MSEESKQSFSILASPPQEVEYNQDLYSALRLNIEAMQRGRESFRRKRKEELEAQLLALQEEMRDVGAEDGAAEDGATRAPHGRMTEAILQALATNGPLTAKEVTAQCGDHSSATTETNRESVVRFNLENLCKSGYVWKDRSIRPYRYSLTRKGSARPEAAPKTTLAEIKKQGAKTLAGKAAEAV